MTQKKKNSSFLGRPFKALRPNNESANEVIAPPYDVISKSEAKELAAEKPSSFLRVSRAELEMANDIDPYHKSVYERAHQNLDKLKLKGKLLIEDKPCFYIYQIRNSVHSQTGLALSASVEAYKNNKIRKHELTRHAKEADRTMQIETVNAITGPVLLVHANNQTLDSMLQKISSTNVCDFSSSLDGWLHSIWVVRDTTLIKKFDSAINSIDTLYIADGHHRSAAAARVADIRNAQSNDNANGVAAHNGFLAVTFPEKDMLILDYNRVIKDLNNLTSQDFLTRLSQTYVIEKRASPVKPKIPKSFGMYLEGSWFNLQLIKPLESSNPVSALDVSVLEETILRPILSITDARTDTRIEFIGGSRGTGAISEAVDTGRMSVGFTLFPTKMAELMTVADAALIMPPKSTWFDPKLADGLLSIPLD